MSRKEYSLDQWLDWMLANHPTEIDLGLGRVGQVFTRMQLDLSYSKIVSIAGTNGKGSTTALLESIYLASGYSTLAYTSPHLLLYNERVRIDGGNAEDSLFITAFNAIDLAMGQNSERISLSYFEIGTLAALFLIAQHKPQIALLEVGLGGRLDAVNIVDADVAVITTLAVDHVDWLGDDIEQIGREKAGIARSGKPLICGELQPPASVAELSAQQGFELYQINRDYKFACQEERDCWSWGGRSATGELVEFSELPLPALPVQNAATALQVISVLGMPCDTTAIKKGLQQASAMGRLQQVNFQGTPLLLDVAHNPQSAQYLTQALQQRGLAGKIQLVLGVLGDKDCAGVIEALSPLVSHWHFVSLDVYRGQSAQQLKQYLASDEQTVSCHAGVEAALLKAVDLVGSAQRVVVAGSFVTVSQVLEIIKRDE
ncbi:MAG: bifunctional tetrahydrofolate synthase/dihydrofolate synthase [Oceanospirillaceae bacterium]|nr:bifunctional tetrahydrofolate synthase/dihydrofolate synthase [Oceanospirillaceae bacterium]